MIQCNHRCSTSLITPVFQLKGPRTMFSAYSHRSITLRGGRAWSVNTRIKKRDRNETAENRLSPISELVGPTEYTVRSYSN